MESVALTRDQEEAVRQEASRILDHPSFRTSDRCSRLFRFLVEESLKEGAPAIKERRAGHEVFGRTPGYDTATDPIVRNVASEIRKRLRNFYNEETVRTEVKIELPPGTYIPYFQFRQSVPPSEQAEPNEISQPSSESAVAQPPSPVEKENASPNSILRWSTRYRFRIVLGVMAVMVLALSAFVFYRVTVRARDLTAYGFWAPVFAEHKEIVVSLGHALHRKSEVDTPENPGLRRVTMTDLAAYTNLASFLTKSNQPYVMRPDTETRMDDLRDRPVILIGNVNNEWVLRLTKDLHYRFAWDTVNKLVGIQEAGHPGTNVWQISYGKEKGPPTNDYAIAERFRDPNTGDFIVCVAGAGSVGTRVASELITTKKYLDLLPRELADPKVNVQIVIRTNIVDGIPGPPEILKTYIW